MEIRKIILFLALYFPATLSYGAQSYGFATYDAVIGSGGAIFTNSGVQSVAKTSTGVYQITFSRPIAPCVAVTSLIGVTPGFATWQRVANTIIRVNTFSKVGVVADQNFSIIVTCGP